MKIVPTPDGLPNELFGDVAMLIEFISCYQGLLMPNKDFAISSGKINFVLQVHVSNCVCNSFVCVSYSAQGPSWP